MSFMNGQKQYMDYAAMDQYLVQLKQYGEEVRQSLKQANTTLTNAIGPAGEAWAGNNSATEYNQSWEDFAEGIDKFIHDVETQAENVRLAVATQRAHDMGGSIHPDGPVDMVQ